MACQFCYESSPRRGAETITASLDSRRNQSSLQKEPGNSHRCDQEPATKTIPPICDCRRNWYVYIQLASYINPLTLQTTGLVGAWIVSHLLARGEDPKAIRILDLISPEQDILNKGVGWIKTNITDELAVTTAFEEPWAATVTNLALTVYHTAAIIRPQDRLKSFLPLSRKVNIDGTQNVLNAAKAAGATAFIWTSSGSIALHQPTFWIAPWATQPKRVVQVISDSTKLPESHYQFFGNYAATKTEAEQLVRAADDPATNFRTGCIRPTNGVYGTGGQANNVITGLYLRNGGSRPGLARSCRVSCMLKTSRLHTSCTNSV